MRKLLTILLLLALLLTTVPMVAFAQTTISNEAEEHILNELNRANIPNAAIAVIQNGETSYILKDSEYDTLFQIGSISKSFTGFGVLLLEDMGLLSVSDTVNHHLPWFEVHYNGVPVPHDDITIYNLLHHTSGFTSDERRFPSTTEEMTKDEMIAQLVGVELEFYPSSGFRYGNVNYIILGFIIEAVSGQSYNEFMTQNVLHPLGLYNTFTNARRAHDTGRVIGGHRLGFLRPRPHNIEWASLTMPTGSMYSSISDMARWAGVHLGTVEISEQFQRVVQRSHIHHHATDTPFAGQTFGYGSAMIYGAGWLVLENSEIGHGGGTHGYISDLKIFPDRDMAVVVLSNLRQFDITQWVPLIVDAVDGNFTRLGLDIWAIADIAFMVIIAIGILFAILFVRLAIKVSKHIRNKEKVEAKLRIRSLIAPILTLLLSIAGLLFIYIFNPSSLPFSDLVLTVPASGMPAVIAVWVTAAHSLFSLWAKVFVNPRVGK